MRPSAAYPYPRDSFGVMCLMISRGLGLGVLPQSALETLAGPLGLCMVTLDEPWAVRPHAVCVRSMEELDPASRSFVEYLTRPPKAKVPGTAGERARGGPIALPHRPLKTGFCLLPKARTAPL